MAALPRVFDGKGATVALGTEIGRGGEGAVYEILGRNDSVAKIYLRPPNSVHQAKLAAMTDMAVSSLLRLAAWPTSTLHGPSGSIIGFAMPKVSSHSPVFKVYIPKLRLQEYPKADWRFLIHAAANTARAFSAIHSAGLVIGDVNHGNLVVGQDATVRLIDCDSFQVAKDRNIWRCEVGVGTHQPPEMQALTSYASVTRTPNHDNFGLAIIIFQMLCMARHPFSGRYLGSGDPPSIEEAIGRSQYAYSRDKQRTMMVAPPGSLPIEALTPDLQNLFEAAFAPGATHGGRPAGERWVAALDQLGSRLRECPLNQAHRYLSSLSHCPWCEIEAISQTPLFPVVFITQAGTTTGMVALWQEVTRQAEPQQLPPLPDPNAQTVSPSATALSAAKKGRQLQICAYTALAGSSVLALAASPINIGLWVTIGVGGLTAAVFKMRKPATANSEQRRFDDVKNNWERLRASWGTPGTRPSFSDVRRELEIQRAKYDGLPNQRAARLTQLAQQIRQKQLADHLDRFPIASAKILGVGAAKAATLASHGIDTAGDIDAPKVLRIPGFGAVTVKRLVDWRRGHEQSFRFDPGRGISPTDLATVERDIALARTAIERDTAVGLARLKALAAAADARRKALNGRAAELLPLYAQAAADARIVRGDATTYKRLLGLAGGTAILALVMFGSGSMPQAGLPASKQATVSVPVPAPQPPRDLPRVTAQDVEAPLPPRTATLAPSVIVPTQSPSSPLEVKRVITRQESNVRDAPNGATVVRTVTQGAVLRVYARRDRWIQVGDDEAWGWIYSGLVTDAP